MENPPAAWYEDALDPTLMRWWNGENWSNRYLPNSRYGQPSLPRHLPNSRLGYSPRTNFEPAVTVIPGWYAQDNEVTWWDGLDWTPLKYPKVGGINLGGGGTSGGRAALTLTAVAALISIFFAVLFFSSGFSNFGFVALAVLVGCGLSAWILQFNLKHIKVLREAIYSYANARAEELKLG